MKPGLTSALIALNVLLAVLIGALWITPQGKLRGTHWDPPAAVRPDLGAAPVVSAAQDDIDTARFVAILDRPLFSTTRRPAPVLAKAGPAGRPDPLDGLHLYGVFSGPDGGGIIARVDGKSRRVKVSETVGDWSLREVRGQQAVFARGPEMRTVTLVQARPSTTTAQTSPSMAAGVPAFGRVSGDIPGLSGLLSRQQPAARPAGPAPAPAAASATPAAAPAPPVAAKPAAPPAKPGAPSNSSSPFVIGGSR